MDQRIKLWVPASTHLVMEVQMFLIIPSTFLYNTTVSVCVLALASTAL